MNEWKVGVEGAPKSGESFIILKKDQHPDNSGGFVYFFAEWWWDGWGDPFTDDSYHEESEIEYWMPLPDPPQPPKQD